MAAIVHSQPAAQEDSAARQFWNEKMAEHPTIAGLLAIAGEVAGFFLNGHFIVALARWVIRVSGYVAESALLFAVLWISATSVAPGFIELFMSEKTMQYLVWLALIALALIPEIILANAIVNTIGHIHTATQQKSAVSWAWAVLFTLPTLLFFVLTAYTLNTLIANGGNYIQASAGLVGLRCFAGWTYGLLEMVYAGVGRRTLNQAQLIITPAQPAPAQQIDYEELSRQFLPLVAQEVRQAVPDTTGMVEQIQQLRADVEELSTKVSTERATKDEQIVNISEYRSFHELETAEDQIVDTQEQQSVNNPRAKVTQKLSTPVSTKRATTKDRETARSKALRILKKATFLNSDNQRREDAQLVASRKTDNPDEQREIAAGIMASWQQTKG
jgi:hypothetical protein